jgi:hypothetical protein
VQSVFATESAVFAEFKLIRRRSLIFGGRVISSFAFHTCKCHYYSHG